MAKSQARKQAEHFYALFVDAVWSASTNEDKAWVRSDEKAGDVLNRLLEGAGEDERKSLERLILSNRASYKTTEDPTDLLYMQIADGFLHALPDETMEQVRNRLLRNVYDDQRAALERMIVARRPADAPAKDEEPAVEETPV